MFQKSARKSVMYGFGRRMSFEFLDKRFIIYKIIFHCAAEILIGNPSDISKKLFIHHIHALLGSRHIICRIIISLRSDPKLFDVQLQIIIVSDHISDHLDKVFLVVICDPL